MGFVIARRVKAVARKLKIIPSMVVLGTDMCLFHFYSFALLFVHSGDAKWVGFADLFQRSNDRKGSETVSP